MLLLWIQLTALGADPSPPAASETTTGELAAALPSAASTSTPVQIAESEGAPAHTSPLQRALATQISPGQPWSSSLSQTIEVLGEPTSQHGEMRCWLFERTPTSCSYWHLTAGTTADLRPGGDATPVVRFVGAGRAKGSTDLPPCCSVD